MNIELDIANMVENCRYSGRLETLIHELGGIAVLHLEYTADYQGEVDIDVLLSDGRVFSYKYSYGSCSGCDEWEARDLNDEQIINEMHKDASFYRNLASYIDFKMREGKNK